MIRQCTVEDIKNKRVTRLHGQIVVVTRFYPRYLKKNLIHEYLANLAPKRELLKEFRANEKEIAEADPKQSELAHNQAFDEMDYEAKFTLSAEGLSELERLSLLSQNGQVYLVCHCKVGARCHREILMIIAEKLYGATISRVHFPWTTFRERMADGSAILITHEAKKTDPEN